MIAKWCPDWTMEDEYVEKFDVDDDPEFDDDLDDDGFGDCGMMLDGQCGKAGSEECDWECPIMSRRIRNEAAKRKVSK